MKNYSQFIVILILTVASAIDSLYGFLSKTIFSHNLRKLAYRINLAIYYC